MQLFLDGLFNLSQWLLLTSLKATIVIAFIIIIRIIFRDRLPAKWQHALWLVLIARLLLPLEAPSSLSIFNLTSSISLSPLQTETTELDIDGQILLPKQNTIINDKNKIIRENRLCLLFKLKKAMVNYANFDLIEITKANTPIEDVEVWLGNKDMLKTYVKEDIYKTIPKARKSLLKVSLKYNGPIQAPIKKDDIIGKLNLIYNGELIKEYDLLAYEDVKKLNVFSRLMKSINFLIWGDV